MKTHTIINKELIFLDEESKDKEIVIQTIAQAALEQGYISKKEAFIASVLAREKEVSTAVGYSIAMPHGKTDIVRHPFIAFMRTTSLFQWSAESDEQVQLIFLIGVPESGAERLHLKFISQVSKKLLDDSFRKELRSLCDTESVAALLSAIDL